MDAFSIQNYFKRGKTVVLTLKHGDEDNTRQWSDTEINDLLKLMKTFIPEFQKDTKRKKDVWEDLSKEFQKTGLSWTPEDLRKKWSNMIRTFKGIEEQQQSGKFKRKKWPFYDTMKELLTADGSDALPEALTVSQVLKGVVSPPMPPPPHNFTRKTILETPEGSKFLTSQPQHHLLQKNSHTLQMTPAPPQFMSTSLVQDSEVFEVTDTTPAQIPIEVATSSNLLLGQNSATASFSFTNLSSGYQRKLPLKSKKKNTVIRKPATKQPKTPEESIDDLFLKFMETTQKQNEQLLEKMTAFHENALTMMQERNILLREIRDGLREEGSHRAGNDSNLTQVCLNNALGNNEVESETLTLHMGPAYSTNPAASGVTQNATVTSQQLNPTLVISDPGTAAALSSFQLEDGTVLSSIDATGTDKNVLNSFTEGMIPEVSLLHPNLVSVVSVPNMNSATNMGLSLSSTASLKDKYSDKKLFL